MGKALDFLLPWDSQPQEVVGIDWGNPLSSELLVSLPLSAPNYTSIGRNPISGTPTAASVGVTPKGTAAKFSAAGDIALGTACLLPTSTTPFTLTLYELPDATSAFSSLVGLSGGSQQWLWIRGTGAGYFCTASRANHSGAQNFSTVGAQVAGVGKRFLLTAPNGVEGTSGVRLWMDGVEQTSTSIIYGAAASATNRIGWDGYDTRFDGKLQDFNLWGRVLSDAEIAAYFSNPYELFIPRSIWVPVSAGGATGYTLTADAGAYTLSGQDAALLKTRIVTADAGSYAVAGQDATVLVGRLITADAGAYTLAGQDATLTYTPAGAYTLTCDAGAYALAGQEAALLLARVMSADAGAYTLSGQDAALTYTPAALPTIGRPASDTSNSGWTASTGSDLYAMLDEVTPDSADYIVTTATGSICEMALQTTDYPGTSAQVLSYRASSSTGNSVIVRLKNTGGATVRSETQVLTSTDTLYEITLTAPEIAAITSGALSVELESA